eukprot:CAMPEP_0197741238 /NCGR_PEP_ID=MMETSP1435-20131217/26971_1 /TAXON_ID=426625 /ORGANISM="Chaetoceros brevis, Strain CCMP164" /LENGTH=50 /DNA_ID=CAMNT_0043331283 /DNA_START=252 /DNA_END=404 /DNA_ORIENTATION=+
MLNLPTNGLAAVCSPPSPIPPLIVPHPVNDAATQQEINTSTTLSFHSDDP